MAGRSPALRGPITVGGNHDIHDNWWQDRHVDDIWYYSEGPYTPTQGGPNRIENNRSIGSLAEAPAAIVSAAGIEPLYQDIRGDDPSPAPDSPASPVPPPTPTHFVASGTESRDTAILEWDRMPHTTSYLLRIDDLTGHAPGFDADVTTTAYGIKVVVGRAYRITVRARNQIGISAAATTNSFAPPPAPAPVMNVDVPAANAVLRQPLSIAGWALDAGAMSGNGIDVVHVYAFPGSGGGPIFLGAAPVNVARADVAGIFGQQFRSPGFTFVVRGLAPGQYTLVVYPHSTVTGTFPIARPVNVRIESSTLMTLDAPSKVASVPQGFLIGGWALDLEAAVGPGVDAVHAYAFPLDTAGGAIFLGHAPVDVARPDVAQAYGAPFDTAGFNLSAPALSPGRYRVVVLAHSTISATFSAVAMVDVAVRP